MVASLNEIFVASQSSREFLEQAFREIRKTKKRFSLERFAQLAGFKSRSYPHLLITGKRKINTNNCEQIISGLQLRGALAEAFRIRVSLDTNPDCPKLKDKLIRLKKRLSLRTIQPEDRVVPQSPYWPIVYASIGGTELFTAFGSIVTKSKLASAATEQTLGEMMQAGLVERQEGANAYRVSSSNIHFSGVTKSTVFQLFFRKACQQAQSSVMHDLNSTTSMFFGSAVSVKKENLAAFKKDLQQLLAGYSAQIEDANGDEVVLIQASLAPLQST
jgi:uncharacterized protein (TIGR02147 family)